METTRTYSIFETFQFVMEKAGFCDLPDLNCGKLVINYVLQDSEVLSHMDIRTLQDYKLLAAMINTCKFTVQSIDYIEHKTKES